MIRRIGSLRNFNGDSHPQEGNLNLQARDETETQSIRDQLNQYDEEEDNYYNDADVDDDEVEEGKEVTPSNVSLSRHLSTWAYDNNSVTGQGASRGMMQNSPDISVRYAGSIGRASLQSPMLQAFPRLFPSTVDIRQPNEYYSTRGG
jgi:hypothetical protein